MAQEDNRSKALEAALSQIDRQFGKGTVMRLGDAPRVVMPSVSTGSLGLDIALGIGGLPLGRVVEIFKSRHENSVHLDNPFHFNS